MTFIPLTAIDQYDTLEELRDEILPEHEYTRAALKKLNTYQGWMKGIKPSRIEEKTIFVKLPQTTTSESFNACDGYLRDYADYYKKSREDGYFYLKNAKKFQNIRVQLDVETYYYSSEVVLEAIDKAMESKLQAMKKHCDCVRKLIRYAEHDLEMYEDYLED